MLFNFISVSLISATLIATTCLITYEVLGFVWNLMTRMHIALRLRVLVILIPIFLTHIISIWIYGAAYFFLELYTSFGHLTGEIAAATLSYTSFMERVYFSSTTYTSLGFGDVVPERDLGMLCAAEVLNGLVLIGWTASFTYLSMEKFWTRRMPKGD